MGESEERGHRSSHRGSASVRRSGAHKTDTGSREPVRRPVRAGGTSEQVKRPAGSRESGVGKRSTAPAPERAASAPQRAAGSFSVSENAETSGSRKQGKGNKNPVIIVIIVGLLAVVLVCGFLLFGGRQSGGEDSETASSEALNPDAIRQDAVIDLSAIMRTDAGSNRTGSDGTLAQNASDAVEQDRETDNTVQTENGQSGQLNGTLLSVKGMTPEEVRTTVSGLYSWGLSVANGQAEVGGTVRPTVDASETTEAATMGDAENPDSDAAAAAESAPAEITVSDRIEVPDLIKSALDELLLEIAAADNAEALSSEAEASALEASEAASDQTDPQAEGGGADTASETASGTVHYTLSLADAEEEEMLSEIAQLAANMWYVAPTGGSIGSYDAASDSFKMEGAKSGFEVDQSALFDELMQAVSGKRFEEEIEVPGETLTVDADAELASYQTIGSYTTKTTSNAVRNKNIQLAAEKLNGTIVRPGEEFSFNNTVGERTAAKGYGAAAAYNEGEVVQEIGGGICQVSTTLYNAVLRAGLKTTKRQSHTFVPTYVTPGFDATVSWGGPDYRFANIPANEAYSNPNSYAIGIRAHYADRQLTISIYGRPVLQNGYTYELSSKKVKDIDIVRKLIEPGSDRTPTKGTKGSQWTTNLIVKKDGQVVSDKLDHNTYYSGHIEYYTDTPETTEAPTLPVPEETPAPLDQQETSVPAPIEGPDGGPGVSATTAPAQSTEQAGPGTGETQTPVTQAPETQTAAGNDPGGAAPGEASGGTSSGGGTAPGAADPGNTNIVTAPQ